MRTIDNLGEAHRIVERKSHRRRRRRRQPPPPPPPPPPFSLQLPTLSQSCRTYAPYARFTKPFSHYSTPLVKQWLLESSEGINPLPPTSSAESLSGNFSTACVVRTRVTVVVPVKSYCFEIPLPLQRGSALLGGHQLFVNCSPFQCVLLMESYVETKGRFVVINDRRLYSSFSGMRGRISIFLLEGKFGEGRAQLRILS